MLKRLLIGGTIALGAYAQEAPSFEEARETPYRNMPDPCLKRDARVSDEELTRDRLMGTYRDEEQREIRRTRPDMPVDSAEIQNRRFAELRRAEVRRARERCREGNL